MASAPPNFCPHHLEPWRRSGHRCVVVPWVHPRRPCMTRVGGTRQSMNVAYNYQRDTMSSVLCLAVGSRCGPRRVSPTSRGSAPHRRQPHFLASRQRACTLRASPSRSTSVEPGTHRPQATNLARPHPHFSNTCFIITRALSTAPGCALARRPVDFGCPKTLHLARAHDSSCRNRLDEELGAVRITELLAHCLVHSLCEV